MFPRDRIVGEFGPEVRVTPRIAKVLIRKLGSWPIDVRGTDEELDVTLNAMQAIAELYNPVASPAVTSDSGSAEVEVRPARRDLSSTPATWVTSSAAARLLGCSDRRVRQMREDGLLTEVSGPPYLFEETDVLALAEIRGTAA